MSYHSHRKRPYSGYSNGYYQNKKKKITLDKEKFFQIVKNEHKFASFRLSRANETLVKNFLESNKEVKTNDVYVAQQLVNNASFQNPVLLNLIPPGLGVAQRVSNLILLKSLRMVLLMEQNNLLQTSTFQDVCMPDVLLRWAVIYVHGDKSSLSFKFNEVFRDYDLDGNLITYTSLFPNEFIQNTINANSYIAAGTSAQGYQGEYVVLKEGSHFLSGVPSTITNGRLTGNLLSPADTRLSNTGAYLTDFVLDLLDPDMLGSLNEGHHLSTTFETSGNYSGTSRDIKDGGVYFIYGASYDSTLTLQPIITIKSRLYFYDRS